MGRDDVICALALVFAVSGCSSSGTTRKPPEPTYSSARPSNAPAPTTPTQAATVAPPVSSPAPAPATTPPPGSTDTYGLTDRDTSPHAFRGVGMGGGPPEKVGPMMTTIPAPPARVEVPPRAGVDTALRAASNAPAGSLGKNVLEGPLRDPLHFARCNVPRGTRIDIRAVIYNGSAVGVDVWTTPANGALSFCIERVVRETSWVKELAVNQIRVTL
jgi:hypothetical protein